MERDVDLTADEKEILEVVEENPLRLEEITEQTSLEFEEVQKAVLRLWDKSLVVSGPDFTFEADLELPPNLK